MGSENHDIQLATFTLGENLFAVDIMRIREIILPQNLSALPGASQILEGVINLRGSVLPVIDLRRRLGLVSVGRSDGQRVMVFLIKGIRTGFIVDSVAEVLRIQKSSIETAPRLSSEQSTLLSRMANLEKQKRMVQLIEPSHLLGGSDLSALADLAA